MKRYKQGTDRNQMELEPMCLEDMISPDSEVRSLEIIIEKMDIKSLGFTYSETKQTSRKPYSPEDMFKLYAYSYFNGIRSSRKIERECYRNIELMWLMNKLKPDFKTIADFRKNNKKAIKEAFKKFSMICCELGLIGKEIIAVDGSKFRASNSRLAYHSKKKVDEKIKHHTKMAEQYMKLLEVCDKEETDHPKYTKEELSAKIDSINNRLEELKILKEEIKENGTIYDTDKDSRMMKTNNNGADICHNVQIAVDDKHHLVVAVDVTSQPVDKEQFYNISLQAKQNIEVESIVSIADKGYYSSLQFFKCSQDNIIPIVSKAKHDYRSATEEYSRYSFKYDEEKGGYICPQGSLLLPYNSTWKKSDNLVYRNLEACRSCTEKEKCTVNKNGRTIHDQPFA
ncbi:MAG: IS1182 family transposase [Eubacterium sp.]|jgi:transposase|nr:IS1182 family transposase [Eubacterium sp.]